MQWRHIYQQAQQDQSNVDFSSRKHFQAAKAIDSSINIARVYAAGGAAVAAGGSIATILHASSSTRVSKYAPILSAFASVSVGIVSQVFLAPAYAQQSVHHREAGVEYASLFQEYKHVIVRDLLNPSTTLTAADGVVQEMASKKAQLDKLYKDCLPPNYIHLQQKHYVHGPAPQRDDNKSETEDQYQARWSQEFKKRQAMVVDEWVKARNQHTPTPTPTLTPTPTPTAPNSTIGKEDWFC